MGVLAGAPAPLAGVIPSHRVLASARPRAPRPPAQAAGDPVHTRRRRPRA
jgi:hypothetical protein